jgi:thiamine-phosphate pyrophosphorylase
VAARAGWAAADLARAYMDGGARLIQVRAKNLPSGQLLEVCDRVVQDAHACGAAVIVNDRVDVARLCAADGVHVGQDDVPASAARQQLGPGAIVGLSTHTPGQAEVALSQPVSYTAVVLELVRVVAGLAGQRPVVAIGGITLDTAPSVIEAGAASVAVITDLLATGDPVARTRDYLQCLTDIAYSRRARVPPGAPWRRE